MTFVHRSLWPAMYRVATTDGTHLRSTLMGVSPEAVGLYTQVQQDGTFRIEKRHEEAAAELEGVVIHGRELDEKGAHVSVLRSWTDWAPESVRSAAKRVSTQRAEAQIADACGWGASMMAPLPAGPSLKKLSRRPRRS